MPRSYSTEAIVLGSHKLGEADRVVTLLTRERGKVPTVVKGVRKLKSRFGGRLEPFTQIQVQMYAGRNLHTLTGADTIATRASMREQPQLLKSGLAVIDMLNRSIPDFERRPRTYNLMANYLDVAERLARKAAGSCIGGPALTSTPAGSARSLALGTQLKLLLLTGHMPHLSRCASCGSAGPLERFSAAQGGALCGSCSGVSFPISGDALTAMCFLLEKPLTEAVSLELDDITAQQVWESLREVCRYHLAFDLRLKPF